MIVVSSDYITLELTSTLHPHSLLSFGTLYLNFLGFPFSRDQSLPRSTTSEYRLKSWFTHLCRLWAQRFLQKRMTCLSSRCSSTDRVLRRLMIHPRALRHSWIRFGWWSNSCSGGLTTVLAGKGSKCGPITSLALRTRKLSVKFISRSMVKKRFPTEESSSEHQQVLGNNELLFRFSNP